MFLFSFFLYVSPHTQMKKKVFLKRWNTTSWIIYRSCSVLYTYINLSVNCQCCCPNSFKLCESLQKAKYVFHTTSKSSIFSTRDGQFYFLRFNPSTSYMKSASFIALSRRLQHIVDVFCISRYPFATEDAMDEEPNNNKRTIRILSFNHGVDRVRVNMTKICNLPFDCEITYEGNENLLPTNDYKAIMVFGRAAAKRFQERLFTRL